MIKTSTSMNFARGLDTKTDPKQVEFGGFLQLVNSVFTTGKRLTKRFGFNSLTNAVTSSGTFLLKAFSSSLTSGRAVASYQGELIALDGTGLYSRSSSDDNWVYKGRLETVSYSSQSVLKNQYQQFVPDSAINATTNKALYVYEVLGSAVGSAPSGVCVSLVDQNTGQNLLNMISVDVNGQKPKAIAIGSNLYVIYYDGSGNLKVYPVSETGIGSPTTIINDVKTSAPNYDVLVNNSILYVAYNQSSNLTVKSYNASLVLQNSATVTGSSANNNISIFADTSNNVWIPFSSTSAVSCAVYSASLSQVLAPTTVDSGASAATTYNVTGCYAQGNGYIFYDQAALYRAGPLVGLVEADFTQPAVGSTVTVLSKTVTGYVGQTILVADAISGDNSYYAITASVPGVSITCLNLGLATNAAPSSTVNMNSQIIIAGPSFESKVTYNTISVTGTVGTAATYQAEVVLSSKAFVANSYPHVSVCYVSQLQGTYFLTGLYSVWSQISNVANISARYSDQLAGTLPRRRVLPQVNSYGGQYQLAVSQIGYQYTEQFVNTSFITESVIYGVQSISFDFSPSQIASQEIAQDLHFGLGAVSMYDGANVVEHGFHASPEGITAIAAGSGGNLSAGSYGYKVVYQWTDNQGQIHQSGSATATVTTSANDSVTLSIPSLALTNKQNVIIAIYRTQVNGSIYSRVDSGPGPALFNSFSSAILSYTDIYSDASIQNNQSVYTTGQLQNQVVPGSGALSAYKNRLIALPENSSYSFWFSQQVITQTLNSTPVEFGLGFIENVGTIGGGMVAAAAMDDKLVLFKRDSIYYLTGTGPAPSGANNDFTDPLLVTVDAGCVDRASVVLMPDGLMFKSDKGIYLLDRGLNAVYIGAPVESYNSQTILAAKLIPNTTQVRFLLSGGGMLVYDYFYRQWSTFSTPAGVSDCIFEGEHTYIASNGTVYQETPNSYFDGTNTAVLMSFLTSWINLAGLQGYERLYYYYLLGSYLSPHRLTLTMAYEYDPAPQQTVTITPLNTVTSTLEQWKVHLRRQTCQSMQIGLQEVYDPALGNIGAGFNMSGINFTLGIKKGWRPIPASRSAG